MKFITEEENKETLEYIRNIGWENYRHISINENISNEPVVIKIKGTISDYAKRNGYVDALDAMKIIENTR